MTNADMSVLLSEMAVLLELEGANPFRVRAYQRAAQCLASLPKSVSGLDAKGLCEFPGIGKSIAEHVLEMLEKGTFAELEELRRKFPAGLIELLRLPGLGPKRARFLFDSAGIADLSALRAAAEGGKLRSLKGFGEKTEQQLLRSLAFADQPERLLYWHARQEADILEALARGFPGVTRAGVAGSVRRGKETVGDIDILCAAKNGRPAVDAFVSLPMVRRVLARGDTKASVLLASGLQCDLRVVPEASFGAALQYFTGSKDHNVALRGLALKKGLTLNEYGVFRLSDKEQKKPLAGRTEEEVYAALGLPWIAPELRENRGELEAAREGRLPRLVELRDVRGDFHNHSTHTDGRGTLETMARAARERGWEWTALGDHSQSLKITNGLSVARLRRSIAEVRRLEKRLGGIRLFRSMEVDILEDGRMDYPDGVLGEIDVVIASVHSRFKQPAPEMTARLERAASNPRVHIMGHLSGRLINRRPEYAFDAEAVLRAAGRAGTALEINGQPDRQDVDDVRARRARELGAPIALDTDAHSVKELSHMSMAVTIARRAWLTPKDVLNCLSASQLERWLAERAAAARCARGAA